MANALVDDPASPNLLALLADEELHRAGPPGLRGRQRPAGPRGGSKLDPVRPDEAVEDFIAFRIERHPMTGPLGHTLDPRDSFTV